MQDQSTPYFSYADGRARLLLGNAIDVLRTLPDESVDCCVTSPPYFGLRDYGIEGQYGTEATPSEYVQTMRQLFAEVRRVLTDGGTLWLNIGDSYYSGKGASTGQDQKNPARRFGKRAVDGPSWGLTRKNLIGIPWRVAFALQDDGWILRNEIVWHKPNAMPEAVADRLSTSHEKIFLFTRSIRYSFDLGEILVDGKNPRDVWTIPVRPYKGAHFAVFPIELPTRCIKSGCTPGGTVLDPFSGSGTTGQAALSLGRRYVGIDINPAYHRLAISRFEQSAPCGVREYQAVSDGVD